jgi:uncharacterized membrane protein YqjE
VAASARPQGPPVTSPDGHDDRPTSEVLRSVVANTQQLVKKELELAKLELQEIVTARLIAAVLAVTAALVALFVLAFAGVTAAKALEIVLAPWAAWLIVTGAYLLVTLLLLLGAYRKATRPPNSPERTKASIDATVGWARRRFADGDEETRP